MATIFTGSFDSDNAGNNNYSYRQIIPLTGGALDQVRVTLQAGNGNDTTINNVSIGIWSGTTMITTAAPVELLFSGVSGCTIPFGTSLASDWVNLTGFTSSDKLVITWDFGTTNTWFRTNNSSGLGGTIWFLVPEASYNKTDPTADGTWSNNSGFFGFVALVETQSTGGGDVLMSQIWL